MTNQIHYPLVQSDDEFDRLIEQNRFYGELTERVLLAAGIQQGMRLLDVGCGGGDVSFLLARLVGPQGAVLERWEWDEPIDVATLSWRKI